VERFELSTSYKETDRLVKCILKVFLLKCIPNSLLAEAGKQGGMEAWGAEHRA